MARIAGINIPDNKRTEIALTYIYGIGRVTSGRILADLGIDGNRRAKDLTNDDLNSLRDAIEKTLKVEGDLRHFVKMNIKRLKEIGCYRGTRHNKGLPVNGQRTKTNNRTVRGNVRRTTSSGRKKASEKT